MKHHLRIILFPLLTTFAISCSHDEPKITPVDLVIEVTVSKDTPNTGTEVTFTLTATNKGPHDATNVVVIDKIATGYTFVSASAGLGTYDATTGTWTIGDLKNLATTTLRIVVSVNASGEYQNIASISGQQPDTTPTNNTAATTTVPVLITNEMLYTYTIATTPDAEVTITGLSQLWKDLQSTSKYHLTIPSSIAGHTVTKIGDSAFYGQSEILSVDIPNTITAIPYEAFRECSGLKSVSIPESVTSIEVFAFYYCRSLENIVIPSSVKTIQTNVFSSCSSLKNITIPDGVTTISSFTFDHCEALTTVTIPNSVTTIANNAFYYCTSLSNITLPNNVKTIGDQAFTGCSSLKGITFPNSVTDIGAIAFRDCSGLESITIPNSVTSIGYFAFGNCEALTSITVDPLNPNFTAIDGVLYNKNQTKLLTYPTAKTGAFSVPNGVTAIGDGAFMQCNGLTSVLTPNSLVTIGSNAFRYCINLSDAAIASNVTTIGYLAFGDCTSLTSVTMDPVAPPAVSTSLLTFAKCTNLTATNAIKVPGASLNAYETASGWSDYAAIIDAQ